MVVGPGATRACVGARAERSAGARAVEGAARGAPRGPVGGNGGRGNGEGRPEIGREGTGPAGRTVHGRRQGETACRSRGTRPRGVQASVPSSALAEP